MATLSLCMIVKNEEDVLGRCLDCVKSFADEIIIVDTGSSDRTKEIASSYTDQVFDFQWIDDFSAARNFSFAQAKMDYCMWLDADDVIREEEQEKIKKLKEQLTPDLSVVMMKYVTAFNDEGEPVFFYDRERIVKNRAGFIWQGRVHEVIVPSGKIHYTDIQIEHHSIKTEYSKRNLNIYEKMLNEGEQLEPRNQFYYGRELYYHAYYEKAIKVFNSFLNGENGIGWVENLIDACRIKSFCHLRLGQEKEALSSLLRSMEFDIPRAESCCDIGKYFSKRGKWKEAVYWYQQALHLPKDEHSGAFIDMKTRTFIPAIELAVCMDHLGRYKEAAEYNELAAVYEPNSPAVKQNREYFSRVLSQNK